MIRTDVKSYYASIDHPCLIERLTRVIQARRVLNLIEQYLRRAAEQGGLFWESEREQPGIAKRATCRLLGSPTSLVPPTVWT